MPPEQITWRSLLALGVSGGIIPCPSALVVLLGAIALNKIGFGLVLVLAFSLGLAATLTAIGMLFIYAGRFFERFPAQGRVIQLLPVFSALFVSVIGAAILWKDAAKADLAAAALMLTATDLMEFGVIDEIVPEVASWEIGSEDASDTKEKRAFAKTAAELKKAVSRNLRELLKSTPTQLVKSRYDKFRKIGSSL